MVAVSAYMGGTRGSLLCLVQVKCVTCVCV